MFFPSPGRTIPILSAFPWERCSIPLITLMASSGLTAAGPCPSCAGLVCFLGGFLSICSLCSPTGQRRATCAKAHAGLGSTTLRTLCFSLHVFLLFEMLIGLFSFWNETSQWCLFLLPSCSGQESARSPASWAGRKFKPAASSAQTTPRHFLCSCSRLFN